MRKWVRTLEGPFINLDTMHTIFIREMVDGQFNVLCESDLYSFLLNEFNTREGAIKWIEDFLSENGLHAFGPSPGG